MNFSIKQAQELLNGGTRIYVQYATTGTWHEVSWTNGSTDCNSNWNWQKYNNLTPDPTTIPKGSNLCKKCFNNGKALECIGLNKEYYNLI